ncbi:hypothetical protein ANO14919_010740 [Xylariales sp. No.14919]|nr:hypothetical protein ANO14919_010740 [Xylariales sp. No.14919]
MQCMNLPRLQGHSLHLVLRILVPVLRQHTENQTLEMLYGTQGWKMNETPAVKRKPMLPLERLAGSANLTTSPLRAL